VDPEKYFSACGNSRKLEIWTLFSDQDPHPRYFGVELLNRTYSPEKLGTGRT